MRQWVQWLLWLWMAALGIADRMEALTDCTQSGFHAHVKEQLLVDQDQVRMEYIKTDMDNGKEAPDTLMIEEGDTIQVLTLDFSFLLQS